MRNFFLSLLYIFLFSHSLYTQTEKPRLIEFSRNVYSQFGEDGIIEAIFNIIGTKSKRCIEFGAWDGFLYSNTANLFSNKEWEAILIECDEEKFSDLLKNVKYFRCHCICEAVGLDEQSLEIILKRNKVSLNNVDLLSIDIDGNDCYIFESLTNLKPRVIVCEYNPTFPAHLDIYASYDPNVGYGFGCSVATLVRIASQKGYSLIALTICNAFFVLNEELHKFKDFEISLDKLRINIYLHYAIMNYRGEYCIIKPNENFSPFSLTKPLETQILGNIEKLEFPSNITQD